MGNGESNRIIASLICSSIFLLCVIIFPFLRIFPFLVATGDGQITVNNQDYDFDMEVMYFYDTYRIKADIIGVGSNSENYRYDEMTDSDAQWAYDMLEYWSYVMIILALIGVAMITLFHYRSFKGISDPSWIGLIGFAIASIGVLIEWLLFYTIFAFEEWSDTDPELGYVTLNPTLGFPLLIIQIAAILILLLGVFPQILWQGTSVQAKQTIPPPPPKLISYKTPPETQEEYSTWLHELYQKCKQGEVSEEEYLTYREDYEKKFGKL
ncbi:MAG: hypothetical protein ACXACI_01925 [Candidatus Hodarchaeales archaeon]|jgi:hypothetical protein